MSLDDVLTRIDTDLDAAIERLSALLRIPSISTDPAYKADCDRAADWLVKDRQSLGIEAAKRPTPGRPTAVGLLADGVASGSPSRFGAAAVSGGVPWPK